jgi:cell division protein FtsB
MEYNVKNYTISSKDGINRARGVYMKRIKIQKYRLCAAWYIKFAALLIIFAGCAKTVVTERSVAREAIRETKIVEKKLENAKMRRDSLKLQIENLKNEDNIEKIAREKYNLVKENERVYRVKAKAGAGG